MMKKILIAAALSQLTTLAIAVNKCTDASGKAVFQDAPCPGKGEVLKVIPASGNAPVVTQGSVSATTPAAATQAVSKSATERQYEALKDERFRREKWVVMNDARKNLGAARTECESEQQRLASSKVYSKNNLAGATRDSSISQEMQAAAAMCDSKLRMKEREVDAAEKICAEIKCIPAF